MRGWGKRLGAVGLAFFVIKGVLWLTVPAAACWLGCRWTE